MSWQPTDLEVSAARRVIAFLEDRRVLYAPDSLEVPSHSVESVLEIRRFLSGELGKLETGSEFAASLRASHTTINCDRFFENLKFATNASYDASRTSNSILTSSLALTPAFPGGLIPKSVCFTVASRLLCLGAA